MTPDTGRIDELQRQIARDSQVAASKASASEMEEAIKIATAEIDRICRFKGQKASTRQALSWPRIGVTDKDGNVVSGVPEAVKRAAAFLAGAYIAGYQIGPENRDHAIALVANLLVILDGLLDPNNPTQDNVPIH